MRRPKAGDIWRWTRDDAETDEQRLHEVMDPSIYAKNARNWIRVPVKLISTGEKRARSSTSMFSKAGRIGTTVGSLLALPMSVFAPPAIVKEKSLMTIIFVWPVVPRLNMRWQKQSTL